MSRQKSMSFSKCSNLEDKNARYFKLFYQSDKSLISNKQNVKNEAFKVAFTRLKIKLIEKFKLKIKLTETKKFNSQF